MGGAGVIFGGPQGSSVARSCHPNLLDQQIRPPGPGRLKVSQRTSEMGEVALCSRAPRARGATASGRVTAPSPGPRAAPGGRLAAAGASIATAWELREPGKRSRGGRRGAEERDKAGGAERGGVPGRNQGGKSGGEPEEGERGGSRGGRGRDGEWARINLEEERRGAGRRGEQEEGPRRENKEGRGSVGGGQGGVRGEGEREESGAAGMGRGERWEREAGRRGAWWGKEPGRRARPSPPGHGAPGELGGRIPAPAPLGGRRGGRRGGEAHPALKTQGPGLREKKKKKVFVPACTSGQERTRCSPLRGQTQS